jgi:hypothetical protein
LKVVPPVAFIFGTIHMNVDTVAISLVILPHSFVNVTVCMPKFAFTICFI